MNPTRKFEKRDFVQLGHLIVILNFVGLVLNDSDHLEIRSDQTKIAIYGYKVVKLYS